MINFHGFKIVKLQDDCTREAIRYFSYGSLVAIVQKNNVVAIKHSGIFDNEQDIISRYNVALCLVGLKLAPKDLSEMYLKKRNDKIRTKDVVHLQYEADRLGFTIINLKA